MYVYVPGETTAFGSETSNAAMLPIAKPYPECTSGRPTECCNSICVWYTSTYVFQCHIVTCAIELNIQCVYKALH